MRAIALAAALFLLAVSVGYGSTGGAVEVSAPATLDSGGHGVVSSISCAAPGDCAAGGYYRDGYGHYQAFVVSETNGSWGNAIEVRGTAGLNTGADARVVVVSCAEAGECAAGGYYGTGVTDRQAFVVSETNGSWGKAIEVPGTATLNTGGFAGVRSISCSAAGECAAGGYYCGRRCQAFVVSETNGSWGNATKVPGLAALNIGGIAGVESISCAAAGECAAGGDYWTDTHGNDEGFVVGETTGSWGNAIEVPGAAINQYDSEVTSISCAAAGECAAGGWYWDGAHFQAFVVSETNAGWSDAIEVPGTAALNSGGARVDSISCAAAGECAAAGWYRDGDDHPQAFVADETTGSWGNAIEVPGTPTLSSGRGALVDSISCAAARECAAGGWYYDSDGHQRALVADETNGSWGNAIEVPGTATLNGGDVYSISCPAAGDCAAGGSLKDGSNRLWAFVVSETNGSWGNAIRVQLPASCAVPNVVGKPISRAKARLNAADCRVGRITRTHSTLRRGRVVAQHPEPGKVLRAGASVALTVSKGKT